MEQKSTKQSSEFAGPAQVFINQDLERNRKKPEQLMNELELLSVPLIEFLNKNFNPHCRIEINTDLIKVVEDVVGVPKNYLTRE